MSEIFYYRYIIYLFVYFIYIIYLFIYLFYIIYFQDSSIDMLFKIELFIK